MAHGFVVVVYFFSIAPNRPQRVGVRGRTRIIRHLSAACRDPSIKREYILESTFEGFEMDRDLLSSADCSYRIVGSGAGIDFRRRNVFPIWVRLTVLVGSIESILSGALVDGKTSKLSIGT